MALLILFTQTDAVNRVTVENVNDGRNYFESNKPIEMNSVSILLKALCSLLLCRPRLRLGHGYDVSTAI